MGEVHPEEVKLACLDDGGPSAEMAQHLRWCAGCRSAVADYHWLRGEIAEALAAAANAAPAPRPRWWAVRERVAAGQRRQIAGRRVSAVASLVLTVCLMLSASSVMGAVAAAQTLPPEAIATPASITVAVSDERPVSLATPTPDVSSRESVSPLLTPVFVPLPTPPQPEA